MDLPFQNVQIGVSLKLGREAAVAYVIEILEPLKVGHGDPSSVDEEVRDDQYFVVHQDAVSSWRNRSIRSLGDYFSLAQDEEAVVD